MTSRLLPFPRRVAVLAGHLMGALPAYQAAATQLGALLAAQGLTLLLPSIAGGLARAVAAGASARGGQFIEVVCSGAVVPTSWPNPDHAPRFASADLHQRYEVADFYQRQALLLHQADAVIVLPGGLETLWELAGAVTLAHLAQHSKPLAFLNVAEFFTPLLQVLAHLQQTGFVSADVAERYLVMEPDPLRLVERLLTHPRWPGGTPLSTSSTGIWKQPQQGGDA